MKHTTKNRIRFGRSSRWALLGLAATSALHLLVHRADAATTIDVKPDADGCGVVVAWGSGEFPHTGPNLSQSWKGPDGTTFNFGSGVFSDFVTAYTASVQGDVAGSGLEDLLFFGGEPNTGMGNRSFGPKGSYGLNYSYENLGTGPAPVWSGQFRLRLIDCGSPVAGFKITSLQLTEGGATVALKFNSKAGQTYRVETSPTLAAGTWADAGVSMKGDGGEQGFDIPTAGRGGAHFFRVTEGTSVEPFMETVPVGNPGNDGEGRNVDYAFRIGKYEVSNAQYVAFLNAVAISDPNGLYNTNMGSDPRGGIERSGESGAFTYAVKTHMGDKPVNYVIWYHAARFCNWLHNGRPSGAQDNSTTENGAYTLTGRTTVAGGTDPNHGANGRNAGARYHLPSDNEWYKAAYYQPASEGGDVDDYWLYPTRSNTPPTLATADETGNINNDTANIANSNHGADWNGQDGNVTTVGSGGPGSASFYGAFDMGGNVAEWDEFASRFPRGYRMKRGGGAMDPADSLDPTSLKSSSASLEDSTYASSNIGFRIATP